MVHILYQFKCVWFVSVLCVGIHIDMCTCVCGSQRSVLGISPSCGVFLFGFGFFLGGGACFCLVLVFNDKLSH